MIVKTWLGAAAMLALLVCRTPSACADPQGPSAHVLGGAPQAGAAPPADQCPAAVPPDAPGGDRNAAATAGTPFGQMNIAATTQWQPVGGEVQFSIGNVEAQPEHVRVYFAWADSLSAGPSKTCARSPSVRFVGVSSTKAGTAYIYAARVPGELGAASDEGPVDGWSHRTRWWSLVPPPAVVFVAAMVPAGGTAPATPILLDRLVGITTPWIAFGLAIGLLAVVWSVLAWWARDRGRMGGPLLRIIATPRGSASLSQFQILIWTAVIGTGVTYVMLLSGNLIDVPDTTLALLGVTGAALVGSKLAGPAAAAPAIATPPGVTRGQRALGMPATPPNPGQTGTPPASTAGRIATRTPRWSDMVMGGQREVEIDLGRLQMLVFTTIAAAFTALTLVNIGQIPDIPTGELGLVGLSNGIYLAHKAAQRGK